MVEKKFIKISSQGIIDNRAFSLMGASSKRDDDTKIGMFGSGLKYSIAYMLRNNIEFKVFSDYNLVKFEVKPIELRDKMFDCIYINDKETSLTTSMGMDWQAWMVIREIYSNSLDEGDAQICIVKESECVPIEDYTVFYIEVIDELKEVIKDWDLYFSEKRTDILDVVHGNKIFEASSNKVIWYRKGIRCFDYESHLKPLFHYDLLDVRINEARTASDTWTTEFNIAKLLQQSESVKIISSIIKNITTSWERELNWDRMYYSEQWLNLLKPYILVPYENAGYWEAEIALMKNKIVIVPSKMIDGLVKVFGDKITVIGTGSGQSDGTFKYIDVTEKQNQYLLKSQSFLDRAGYKIKYPIHVVSFVNNNILGRAFNEEILLSEKLFEYGIKKVIQVIIEENEHLAGGYKDETRDFQDRLFQLLVSSYEDKINYYL